LSTEAWQVWVTADGEKVLVRTQWRSLPDVRGSDNARDQVDALARRFDAEGEDFDVVGRYTRFILDGLRDFGWELVGHTRRENLASSHLQAAVRQAEQSAIKELEAKKHFEEFEAAQTEGDKAFKYVAAASALDRAVEASRAAVILAVASLEAFINGVGADLPSWSEEDDWSKLEEKWLMVPARMANGRTFDRGRNPYQDFRKLVRLRNRLVHPRPREDTFTGPLSLILAMGPSSELDVTSRDGREACRLARAMILEFCKLVGWRPPNWCAYVPPVDADDLTAWSRANILTGIRDDPDVASHHHGTPATLI
jgi:hypothetical protein